MQTTFARTGRLRLPLAALAAALLLGSWADAREAWDQAAVTTIASDLARATRELKNTLHKEPHLQDAAEMGDPNAQGLWEAIKGLDKSTRQLASRTKDGEGYDETLNIARKIRTQVRDAERYGVRFMTSAFMEEKIGPVEALLEELAPFYF